MSRARFREVNYIFDPDDGGVYVGTSQTKEPPPLERIRRSERLVNVVTETGELVAVIVRGNLLFTRALTGTPSHILTPDGFRGTWIEDGRVYAIGSPLTVLPLFTTGSRVPLALRATDASAVVRHARLGRASRLVVRVQ